jgi:DNA polymerase
MPVLHRDLESRSTADLRIVGAHCYARHPSTEMLCYAYAVDSGPIRVWRPGEPIPQEFHEAAADPSWMVAAHNDAFESTMEEHLLAPRYGWPLVPAQRHRCTMARASALALPAKLDTLAQVLGLEHQKDAAGHRLMLMMSKPRRPHKDEDPAGLYWFEDKDRMDRLVEYCVQDVKVERDLDDYFEFRPLSLAEEAVWRLSNTINNRGFRVDRELAEAAAAIAKAAGPEIDAELTAITGGIGINQVAKLIAWLRDNGCEIADLKADTVEKTLLSELPPAIERVLKLRLGGAQAASKKIAALLSRCNGDGRVRGAFKYHSASPGRWSGEGFQPQNLKNPEIDDVDAAIAAVRTADYAHVKDRYPRPLAVVGDLGRSMIVAGVGARLIGADFSAIESRVLAWLADEKWKLDAYRRYDATQDPADEVYCRVACAMLGRPPGSITPDMPERKLGKVGDLACGYAGGPNAVERFAPGTFTEEQRVRLVQTWRAAHPRVRALWRQLEAAAWDAVATGRPVKCGAVTFERRGMFLVIVLPSGRSLHYPFPRTRISDKNRPLVSFHDASAGQWRECRNGQGAYGGLWTENIVQAIARDLLADAMMRVDAAGYPIVLHVHDEICAEVPDGFGSEQEFTRLMTVQPPWALTLPIAAKAWSGPRFQ